MIIKSNFDITITLYPGPVLESLAKAGIFLQSACGGIGKCGKCRVYADQGAFHLPDASEKLHLESNMISDGMRLACRLKPTGVYRLHIPKESLVADSEIETTTFQSKVYAGAVYGLAIDLGTTRITALLIRLGDKKRVATSSTINPQIYYGFDILSRLKAATQGHAKGLKNTVVHRINLMIASLCNSIQTEFKQIVSVCLVGNTAMTHLLLGMDVSTLVRAPYVPLSIAPQRLKAVEIGVLCNTDAPLMIPGGIGGFVGSDHVAFITALNARKYQKPFLALDIGTNTEIVFFPSNKGIPVSLSVPSGPAFEGGHVSCGQIAGKGVVDALSIGETGFELSVIGEALPTGLCGSALIQALSESYRMKIIDKRGRILTASPFVKDGSDGPVVLIRAGNKATGISPITLGQSDIDALLLAKAAIRTGIDTLLYQSDINPKDIKTLILSGAFGSKLDIGAAFVIGLFPASLPKSIELLVDAAATGAAAILLQSHCDRHGDGANIQAKTVSYVNLINSKGFKKRFARSFYFPEH